jgi:hypothetical protein
MLLTEVIEHFNVYAIAPSGQAALAIETHPTQDIKALDPANGGGIVNSFAPGRIAIGQAHPSNDTGLVHHFYQGRIHFG